MHLRLEMDGRHWRTTGPVHDISIPLRFDGVQPNHFDAPAAHAEPLHTGGFVGDTGQGGSCNCATLTLTPHCNGTHTETLAHLAEGAIPATEAAHALSITAQLVTVTPVRDGDALLIDAVPDVPGAQALIVRTLPNDDGKRHAKWEIDRPAPYFTEDTMRHIVALGVEHLLFDGPSIDRTHDEGRLACHRIFWGMPATGRDAASAERPLATITEMIHVPDEIADGHYLLSLQLAPFVSDAAPSRPLIQRLEPA